MLLSDRGDRELICQDLSGNYTGRLSLTELKVTLTSFDKQIDTPKGDILLFALEERGCASLLNWTEGSGQREVGVSSQFTTKEFIADTVLIGHRPWTDKDHVRHVAFTFTNAEIALHYTDHLSDPAELKRIQETRKDLHVEIFNPERSEIASFGIDAISVMLRMSTSFGGGESFLSRRLTSVPYVSLNFKEPITLEDAYRRMRDVLSFFELSIGVSCQPLNISVSPDTEDHFESYWDKDEPEPLFDVYWYKGEGGSNETRLHPSVTIFKVNTVSKRADLCESLANWINQRSEWYVAYSMMSAYLASESTYSPARVLRLMAWFESIPIHQERLPITPKQIKSLAEASKEIANRLSLSLPHERLREVLSALRFPSLSARLEKAIFTIRTSYGDDFVGADLLENCLIAKKIRDNAAHGNVPTDPVALRKMVDVIQSLELVCALSMLLQLKSDRNSIYDARRHSLLTHYWNKKFRERNS